MDSTPGEPPGRFRLAITAPPSGTQFEVSAPIAIRAVAVDRLDAVYSLDFFADGVRIGTSTIATLVALPPGTPVEHEWTWLDAAPGTHVLEVRVPDPAQGAVSPPVTIHVGRKEEGARVRLLQPEHGAEFHAPASVELVAEAVDPQGLLTVVEFLANGTVVGTSVVDFCPPCNEPPCPLGPCILPPAGMPLTHRFVWEPPASGRYVIEARALRADGDAVVSDAVHIAVFGVVSAARLAWESPPEGSVWVTPGEVPLEITAVDPDGEIRRVEFFAGDHRIGVFEILTREVEIPGRPRSHRLVWTNPPEGRQSLQARATSRAGDPVVSSVRVVGVQGSIRTPVVWVDAVDAEAVEGDPFTDGPDGPADVLRFRVHRSGGPERDLQVFYLLEGDARPGEDYPAPGGSVSLPAGTQWADVMIRPMDDGLVEGDERVVLSLMPSPTMGPVDPYRIDPQRGRARGVIRDAVSSVPVVTVHPGRPYAIEGDGFNRAEWVLQRQGDASHELHVFFSVGGQAVRGDDYRLVRNPCDFCDKAEEVIAGDSVVLHAGESWVTIAAIGLFDGMLDRVEPVLESLEFQVLTPPVPAVVGARPPYVAGAPDRVVAQVVERRTQGEAELVIIEPAAGAILSAGIPHEVRALGVDPQGSIRRMELSANGVLVAVSEITTEEVDVPGRLREHQFQWLVSDASLTGTYTLEISAFDAAGKLIRSPGVPVTVSGTGPDLPVITISTGKSPAFEAGDSRSRTGTFVLHRKGDTRQPLTVFVVTGGTATLGTDYRWSNGPGLDPALLPPIFGAFLPVTFEEGAGDTTLALAALADGLLEGQESVRLELIPPPILALDAADVLPWPFPANYLIGEPRAAEVLIEDADITMPAVRIAQPAPESQFAAGQDIEIVATAVHPEAGIHGIQFLVDGQVIGVDEYCCMVCDCAGPIPGQPFTGRFVWRGASVGAHVLVARPLLGLNRLLESAPVTIRVVES
ncbi:MAG: hypothetical protein J0L84_11570, partial [Verrucomicrobia bacterium]|nr:hypothetical protein [Verrucomicrobiota bacterium]